MSNVSKSFGKVLIKFSFVLFLLLILIAPVHTAFGSFQQTILKGLPFCTPKGSEYFIIQTGWWTQSGFANNGIDYKKINATSAWSVHASLGGTISAIRPPTANSVTVTNVTGYYETYSPLSHIPSFTVGQHISTGQFLGKVNASDSLHFGLIYAQPTDPYGIFGKANQYPDPAGINGIIDGNLSFWKTHPPTYICK